MLNIYHAPFTRAFRVIWLCEELGIEYQLTRVDFSTEYRSSAEWRALNPVGKVPVMTDGDLTMFESGAMMQYVLDRYGEGRLQPVAGTHAHALYLQWSWFAEATFSRPVGEVVNHRRAFPGNESDAIMDEMAERTMVCADAIEGALDGHDYLVSDAFGAADIMVGYPLMLVDRVLKRDLPPRTAKYWAGLQDRDAFQATLAAQQNM